MMPSEQPYRHQKNLKMEGLSREALRGARLVAVHVEARRSRWTSFDAKVGNRAVIQRCLHNDVVKASPQISLSNRDLAMPMAAGRRV